MFAFRSIIIVTTQFMSPALHKNFSEADFDFKVSYWSRWGLAGRFRKKAPQRLFSHSVFDTQSFNHAFYWPFFTSGWCVLGVELLFQPHCTVHQPAQSAAGGTRPGEEKESPRQVRARAIDCVHSNPNFSWFNFLYFFRPSISPCRYGDMRVMMAYELFSMWQKLGEAAPPPHTHVQTHTYIFFWISPMCFCLFVWSGDNKPHFIPGMMGPFLGVTLVPQTEVRNIMIPIFHDMMDWEQRKNGNFKQVTATSSFEIVIFR